MKGRLGSALGLGLSGVHVGKSYLGLLSIWLFPLCLAPSVSAGPNNVFWGVQVSLDNICLPLMTSPTITMGAHQRPT